MQKTEKLPVTFAKNDVEIIARETLYSGFFSMDLYRFTGQDRTLSELIHVSVIRNYPNK